MTEREYDSKVRELDQLLNDPDVPMEPARVWALLAEISHHDVPELSSCSLSQGGMPLRG